MRKPGEAIVRGGSIANECFFRSTLRNRTTDRSSPCIALSRCSLPYQSVDNHPFEIKMEIDSDLIGCVSLLTLKRGIVRK
jgi:hypothetical protein